MKHSLFPLAAALVAVLSRAPAEGQPPAAPYAGGGAPFAGGGKAMTSEAALKTVVKTSPGLAPLEKSMKTAQAHWKKKPKDAKLKAAYVNATYQFGHAVMTEREKLSPRIKYRAALALYRKALAVDPKHKPSLTDKKMIEEIYVSMGMPVPK